MRKQNISKKRNDERGTRTPGMRGITGLAIPRHTGLGYLVTKEIKKRVPINAFHVFNLFRRRKHFSKLFFPEPIMLISRVQVGKSLHLVFELVYKIRLPMTNETPLNETPLYHRFLKTLLNIFLSCHNLH